MLVSQRASQKQHDCRQRCHTGRKEPVDTDALATGSRLGLGRGALEDSLIAAETGARRQLAVEAQRHETEQQREQRAARVEEQARVKAGVEEMQRAFYCDVRAVPTRMPALASRAATDCCLAPALGHAVLSLGFAR